MGNFTLECWWLVFITQWDLAMETKSPPPQFNLTVFNHVTQITANARFCQDLLALIRGDKEFEHEFSDFADDLALVMGGEAMTNHEQNEYQIVKFGGLRNFFFMPDFAKVFSEFILEKAGIICKNDPDLSVNLFVAFGRKLKNAADNDYNALENGPKNKGPVREIIVRRVTR